MLSPRLATTIEAANNHALPPSAIARSFCHVGQKVELHFLWHAL
jgi:hypothetical protein